MVNCPKSLRLFWKAVKSTRHEMWVSLQVLVAATLLLSLGLYMVEHKAQPDVFRNYWDALLWSFMDYIGDPGKFAVYKPITFWGRLLNILCAFVKIAIFAVPAGLVANGFRNAISADKRAKELNDFKQRLMRSFRRKQDRYTKYRVVPRYVSPVDVQALQEIDTKDIIDAVRHSDCFRLRNLASAVPTDKNPHDRLVIETMPTEGRTAYGCCIDRESSVTIVAPTAAAEVALGNFAYYLALYGGFNYVSKERDEDRDSPRSYYLVDDDMTDVERHYIDDVQRLTRGGWVIFVIASDSVHSEQLHFITSIQPKLNAGTSTVIDSTKFDELYAKVSSDMASQFRLMSERDLRYLPVGKKNAAMRVGAGKKCNAFTLRIDWAVAAFDDRYIAIASALAQDFAAVLTPGCNLTPDPLWKSHGFGY